MGYDGGWDGTDWAAMVVMMLLFWGLLAALVVWVVRAVRPGRDGGRDGGRIGSGADRVLAERYARGEIDDDEYRRRRGLLHEADHPPG